MRIDCVVKESLYGTSDGDESTVDIESTDDEDDDLDDDGDSDDSSWSTHDGSVVRGESEKCVAIGVSRNFDRLGS